MAAPGGVPARGVPAGGVAAPGGSAAGVSGRGGGACSGGQGWVPGGDPLGRLLLWAVRILLECILVEVSN